MDIAVTIVSFLFSDVSTWIAIVGGFLIGKEVAYLRMEEEDIEKKFNCDQQNLLENYYGRNF